MAGFERFRERRLRAEKFGADIIAWLALSSVLPEVPAFFFSKPKEECTLPILSDAFRALDGHVPPDCTGLAAVMWAPLLWVVCAVLRVGFLASPWQAGPLMRVDGLHWRRMDGGRIGIAGAVRIAVMEWLPFHVHTVWVLTVGPENVYEAFAWTIACFGLQVLWLAPVIFRVGGRNIAEWLAGADVTWTPRQEEKLRSSYEKKQRRGAAAHFLSAGIYVSGLALYVGILSVFIFFTVQSARAPEVDIEYERTLYAGWEPVWTDNNIYFALEGMSAPSDVTDIAAYGKAYARERFVEYEDMKRRANVTYAYDVPPPSKVVLRNDEELRYRGPEEKRLWCLYDRARPRDEMCMTAEEFEANKADNQMLWERFNAIPRTGIYHVPPQAEDGDIDPGGHVSDMVVLAQMKAADIVLMAERGEAEAAIREWIDNMGLYRQMANARDSMVMKAIMLIVTGQHMAALENVVNVQPEAVRAHAAEIEKLLLPEEWFTRTEFMLADDLALIEPYYVQGMGNVNAVRNDMAVCVRNYRAQAGLNAHEFPYEDMGVLCPLEKLSEGKGLVGYALSKPGVPTSNIAAALVAVGTLKGRELLIGVKRNEARMRMARLVLGIVRDGVMAEDVAAYVAAAPEDLRDPITRAPFMWDDGTQMLSFKIPGDDKPYSFKVPLNAAQ